mmetsp:Transcript_54070/g.160346  ORF Transcript_54070/g.160346 Transcript_54070/m.160346 type:complete len:219 (+) Transcript_54070:933-1589(+)
MSSTSARTTSPAATLASSSSCVLTRSSGSKRSAIQPSGGRGTSLKRPTPCPTLGGSRMSPSRYAKMPVPLQTDEPVVMRRLEHMVHASSEQRRVHVLVTRLPRAPALRPVPFVTTLCGSPCGAKRPALGPCRLKRACASGGKRPSRSLISPAAILSCSAQHAPSIESRNAYRRMKTSRVWPSRWMRPAACTSCAGSSDGSIRKTRLAAVSVMPTAAVA